MKILLCAATEMEIAPTIRLLALHSTGDVHVVITGVGLMAATYSITKAIASNQPDFIIQAGVAGTLDSTLAFGQTVVVKTETVGDAGVQEGTGFSSLFDLQLANEDLFPWKNRQLINDSDLLDTLSLPLVNGVTVNEISTAEKDIQYYSQQLGAQVESMEGAALHYVGLVEKVAFLQLRSISNFIGERDKTKWRMKEAIANLNHELQNIITKHFTT